MHNTTRLAGTLSLLFVLIISSLIALHFAFARKPAPRQARSLPAGKCEMCGKPLVADKVVKVKVGEQQHRYRCVHCALTAMDDMQQATAQVPSGLDKKLVRITKQKDQWQVQPAAAVFLVLPETAGECIDRHLAFVDQAEFTRYLKIRPDLKALSPKQYRLTSLKEMLAAGRPRAITK